MTKKIIMLSLFLVFIVAFISIPLAFAADSNLTATSFNSSVISNGSSASVSVLSDNNTVPDMPNGTIPDNGTPPDMPNGTIPNGTLPNGTMPNGTGPDNISVATTNLTGNNFIETYGAGENFTVTLTDLNGTAIVGQHISLNLTRVSSGASKVYWATTDTDGNAQLQINLSPGYYTVNSSYSGNDSLNYTSSSCFNTIIVYNATTNTTATILLVQPFTEVYGDGENFTATLKDVNGNLLVGQHVALNLTRLSSGASKVYWVTTDTYGNAQLQINLGVGSYTVMASYGGNNNYSSSSASTTIVVTSNGTSNTTFGNDSYNVSLLTSKLSLNMSKWKYDSTNNIYYQLGIVYCVDPETTTYESLGIYVPGSYMTGTKNSDGTYTCTLNTASKVGNYTVKTAPIVMPINTPGYSAQAAPTSYSSSEVKSYTSAGFVYVFAGCRGRSNGDNYTGGAPWGVTDLKAAVTYLKFNNDTIPGDTERIFTFGMSGGGAQSALMGATGDSSLYTPYLESIGAAMVDKNGNNISNSVCGSMCWCPITSLDYADEAYEWNIGQYATTGTRVNSTWTSALSDDLATQYALYLNQLGLKSVNGTVLSLNATSNGIYASGTYYDYLLSVIEESLNNYLSDTTFSSTSYGTAQAYINSLNSDETWVIYNSTSNTATITSIEAFVNHCKSASKSVGAFDSLSRSAAENDVFGNSTSDSLHFDAIMAQLLVNNSAKYATYSDYSSSYATAYTSDLKALDILNNTIAYRVDMYNPMYYLCDYYAGAGTSNVAKYWRINTGIDQGDTALTVETNLALALEQCSSVKSVDFTTVWAQGHTQAERTGSSTTNFINWVNTCLNS